MQSIMAAQALGLILALSGCGGAPADKPPLVTTAATGEGLERSGVRLGGLDVGDLNGDGLLDIVVAEIFSDDGPPFEGFVTVVLQSSPGAFEVGVTYEAWLSASTARIGDVNADGAPDVVVGSWSTDGIRSDRLTVFSGDGGGRLEERDFVEVPMRLEDFELADLDADGQLDVVATGNPSTIVLMNAPAQPGQFDAAQLIDQRAADVDIGDLDGDGQVDLVLDRSAVVSAARVYRQDGGWFELDQDLQAGGEARVVRITDLDVDGRADLIVAYGASVSPETRTPRLAVFPQEPEPALPATFGAPTHYAADDWPERLPTGVAVADFNGDGRPDVASIAGQDDAVEQNNFGPKWRFKTHVAVFNQIDGGALGPLVRYLIREDVEDLTAADMNGDGLPDLVVSGDTVSILFNNPASPSTFLTPVPVGTGAAGS